MCTYIAYRNYFLFGNYFNFGMENNIDISFGFELASLLFESSLPLVTLGFKKSHAINDYLTTTISLKTLFNNYGAAIVISTPVTFGNYANNISVMANAGQNLGESDGAVIFPSCNFTLSPSKKVRFITDIVYAGDIFLTSSMLQYSTAHRISFDIGIIYATDDFIVPIFGFTVPMTRRY